MTDWLTWLVIAGGVLVLIVAGVAIARDEEPQDRTFGLLGVVELLIVAQLVYGCVALAGNDRDVQGVLFVSYLVGLALVLPIGAFWSLVERTRWGSAVLGVAGLTVLALELRLDMIWDAAHA